MNAPIPGQSYRLEDFKVPVPLDEADGFLHAEVELNEPRPRSVAVFVCEQEECIVTEVRAKYVEGLEVEAADLHCPNCGWKMAFSHWQGSATLRPVVEVATA